ncbi:MAG: LPS export ABC transporter permease LptG [Desulfuromonadales bacterium]|nr:LPS export ABC transporter permease LptG [Desulfuromonadales bacterium]
MRTIDRHIAALFLRNLVVILVVLVGLYGLIEFFERVDDFIEYHAALGHYLRYPLYKLPFMLDQSLPMAILLAAFATVGLLARTSQITALRSCGIGLWQATRPVFIVGALLCLATLLGNAWLVPWSARESAYILATEIKGYKPVAHTTENLYFRDEQRIISVAQSFPERREVRGLTVLELDETFHLSRRVEAVLARHQEGGRWLLLDATERVFNPATQDIVSFNRHRELPLNLGRPPEEMLEIWYKPQEMSFADLLHLDRRLRQEGHDSSLYLAEWQLRLARSATPLLMVLLGVPFALHRGRKANLGLGIAVSLTTFLAYFALQAIGMALGTAGLLPLPLAAWSANILLLLVGAWLFLTLDN